MSSQWNRQAEQVPPASADFSPEPDRWDLAMPEWRRYPSSPMSHTSKKHWYDPFNRNQLKGDYPIFGQRWFFNFTGTSVTVATSAALTFPAASTPRIPTARILRTRRAGLPFSKHLRFSFDLFRGDTSFRPVDFRVRFTPEINLNYLQTRERGHRQHRSPRRDQPIRHAHRPAGSFR